MIKRSRPNRQSKNTAAGKANARTYPRPLCQADARPNYTYKRVARVPPRDAPVSDRWDTKDMPKTVQKRNPVQMSHNTYHKAIYEHGIRKRYSEFKIAVLQVLNAPKQKPPKSTPFELGGPDVHWVQTTLQLHEGGTTPFTELPGMHP